MKTIIFILAIAFAITAHADDRRRRTNDSRNYILRRQQAYQVQGTPTKRLYIGGRQIDIYSNGLMFERDNVVGVARH